ncbi:MAG: 6-carboxytetrahydropterin synthase QueD [Gammaproteobacteria bacterium]
MDLFLTFDFAAARRLPRLAATHPCSRVHGHTFMVRLVLRGEVAEESGWMVDFGSVEAHLAELRERLDHRYLNDIEGLENPTTERLAEWLWRQLAARLDGLHEITVQEHPARGVTYRGPH